MAIEFLEENANRLHKEGRFLEVEFNKEFILSEFNEAFQKHQELSRTAAAGKFK